LPTGVTASGSSSGNTNIINETLTNSGSATANVNYKVTLTKDGCPTDHTVTVTVNPTPTVTITGAPAAVVCHDTQISDVTFSGTATKYKWKITSGAAATAGLSASEDEITVNPATLHFNSKTSNTGISDQSVTIEVTPYYSDNCAASNTNKRTFTFTVKPELRGGEIEADNNANTKTICSGETVTLNNKTNANYGNGAKGFQWQYWDGSAWQSITGATSETSYTVTPAAVTVQTTIRYRRMVKDACNVEKYSNEVTITVKPKPTKGAVTGDDEVCAGSAIQLSNTTAGGLVTWKSENEAIATVTSGGAVIGVVTGVSAGNTRILCIVTNTATGCSDTAYHTVTVKSKPNAGTITGATAVCEGSTITLNNLTSGGEWKSTNESSATVSNGVVTGVSSGATTIWYIVADASTGCSDTANHTVTVNPKPNAGTLHPAGDTAVCINNTIILEPTVTVGGNIASVTWISDDENIATVVADGADGKVTGKSAGEVDIWYKVTSTSGCSKSVSQTITVKLDDKRDYSDLRLFVCPSVGVVNLSKFIDTVGVHSVDWKSTNLAITSNGELDTDKLYARGAYALTYTVEVGCYRTPVTRKVYLKTLRDNEFIHRRGTIMVCHERAEAVQIDQIFGIEAGAAPSYDPSIALYISKTSYGGIIFDGKKYYADQGGSGDKPVTFTYTAASGSCLDGKTYTLVVMLTQQ
jgi:hypothetical protein